MVISAETRQSYNDISHQAPEVGKWKNPDNSADISSWLMFQKTVPHDLRSSPFQATMLVGGVKDNPRVRLISARPSDEGTEYAFFDIALGSGEIQFCFPTPQQATYDLSSLSNPNMPLHHQGKRVVEPILVMSLVRTSVNGESRKQARRAGRRLNAILDALIPDGWDSSGSYALFQEILNMSSEQATDILEMIKQSAVVRESEREIFFDPNLT